MILNGYNTFRREMFHNEAGVSLEGKHSIWRVRYYGYGDVWGQGTDEGFEEYPRTIDTRHKHDPDVFRGHEISAPESLMIL